jgi:hypothetical protein
MPNRGLLNDWRVGRTADVAGLGFEMSNVGIDLSILACPCT